MRFGQQAVFRTPAVLLSALVLFSCSEAPADIPLEGAASPYLFVFAGDQDQKDSDFLATIDVSVASETRGRPLTSVPIGHGMSMPHHMEYVPPPAGEPIFMNGHHHEVSLIVDMSDPLAIDIKKEFRPPEQLRYPHDYERTQHGTRLVGFLRSEGASPDPNETTTPGGHGGIAEYDMDGNLIRQVSAGVTGLEKPVRPYAFAILPDQDRFLVTSAPMHETSWADVVQIYSYSDFQLLHTIDLPAGKLENGKVLEGSQRAGFGPRLLDDGSIFLNSYGCAFYHITDISTDAPKVNMVHALKTKPSRSDIYIRGACGIPVRTGNYWIQPVGHLKSVVVLDISDPREPKEVYRLKTPGGFKPHWLAKDPLGNRLVLGAELGGEDGFFMLRFDEKTGRLAFDKTFNGKMKGRFWDSRRPGYISLSHDVWPHGETGAAWGHAALFLGSQ